MSESAAKQLFARFWTWRMNESPEFATFCGEHEYDDRLDDYSVAAFQRREKAVRDFLAECDSLLSPGGAASSDEDRLSLQMLKEDLKVYISGAKYLGYVFCITYNEGIHMDFEQLISWMLFNTLEDYRKYLARLRALPRRVEQVEDLLKLGLSRGLTHHKQTMRGLEESFKSLGQTAESTVFYEPFTRTSELHNQTEWQDLCKQAVKIIQKDVQPGYRKLWRFIEHKYMHHLRPLEGVSCLPNGLEFYQECLRWHLSIDMTPDEVHRLGQQEVERIRKEMKKIIEKLGYQRKFKEFLQHLRTDKRFYFDNQNAVIEGFQDLCYKKIRPVLYKRFHNVPKSNLIIEPVPPSRVNAPAGYYLAGTSDGSRPGKFYINAHQLNLCPKYEMMTLSLHEGEPGHHFQGMCAIEMRELPSFRKYLEDMNYYAVPSRFPLHTAFCEGWGLYSEYLGEELGLYEDPYDMFGHLSFEMHRACRLVADTGIHAKGWTFEQAVQYFRDNTALAEAFIDTEVRRYITWPGQACAYKIGELKLKELRQKAQTALGPVLDVRDFHNAVLQCGIASMSVLEQVIDKYIKNQHTVDTKF